MGEYYDLYFPKTKKLSFKEEIGDLENSLDNLLLCFKQKLNSPLVSSRDGGGYGGGGYGGKGGKGSYQFNRIFEVI